MGKFVEPKVYFVGYQVMNESEVWRYLKNSGNQGFMTSIDVARNAGITDAEILCSLFAKLCYKSLTAGHNDNISRVRDIEDNLKNCFDVGHGSVFEHVNFNFVVSDCSRVYTHEQVRHRVGTAYSQNSGRYIRSESLDIVFDPILEPIRDLCEEKRQYDEDWYRRAVGESGINGMKSFSLKKKMTSALRRFLPNGQSNEIAMTLNLRTIRHTVMLRTSRHAEWEIRKIYEGVYLLLKDKYRTMFHGAKEDLVDGIVEVTGMKLQPHEKSVEVLLSELTDEQLEVELASRRLSRLPKMKP